MTLSVKHAPTKPSLVTHLELEGTSWSGFASTFLLSEESAAEANAPHHAVIVFLGCPLVYRNRCILGLANLLDHINKVTLCLS
jgi:hypothetical protein